MRARLAWLRRFRRLIAGERASLASLIEQEVGKPRFEALTADVMSLLASCKWHEQHAARVLRDRTPVGRPMWMMGQRHVVRRVPIGTVAIIATWNYPLFLIGVQLVQAIIAGNRVVVKPSERSPRTQQRLLELAQEAQLPEGVLTPVPATRDAGRELLARGDIDHVLFVGSTSVGKSIAEWAAGSMTTTTLELSGRDSAIVLDDADPELAAKTIWHAVTLNAGQTCMAPRRALVDNATYERFVRALSPHAASAKAVRLIDEGSAQHADRLVTDALNRGARTLLGIHEPSRERSVRPTAVVDCPRDAELVRGDHFAPLLAVVRTEGLEDALALHTSIGQHLATSVFTRSPARARAIADHLCSGCVTINDCIIPAAHPGTPFGGRGASGWGVMQGPDGLLELTRAVHISETSPRIRPPVGEQPGSMADAMSRVIGFLYGNTQSTRERSREDAPRESNAVAASEPKPSKEATTHV